MLGETSFKPYNMDEKFIPIEARAEHREVPPSAQKIENVLLQYRLKLKKRGDTQAANEGRL